MTFAIPAAIWALTQLVVKLYEFKQSQEKLRLEVRNFKLQNEKLRREINNLVLEARKRDTQETETLPEGEEQLFVYGQMLTGGERIFVVRDFRFADGSTQAKPYIIGGDV